MLHGSRLSHSYTEALPDFVKLAEAYYGGHGIRCEKPRDLDDAIREMIAVKKPVLSSTAGWRTSPTASR